MDTEQAHTHVPLPPSTHPLRSALKHTHRDSQPNSPSPSSTFVLSPSSTFALSPTDSPSTPRSSLPPLEYTSPTTISLPLPPSSASTALSHSPSQASASTAATNYTPKVSFDTFENPLASMFSFTLSAKSAGYRRSRNTCVFLCAASPDESGRQALDWALESLVQDGDELIVFRGVDEEVLDKMDHDVVREEARELMRNVQEKSAEYGP